MANPEHLKILKAGVLTWNKWRVENKNVVPDFEETDLDGADLNAANLSGADLNGAELLLADLNGACLRNAFLQYTNLNGTKLSDATLQNAHFEGTLIGGVDFSQTIGLESIKHLGPSSLGIDTLFLSKGKIPEAFLRGVGAPSEFIDYAESLTSNPILFYSTFISYSSKDETLAKWLHSDLQAKGVRCWFAPEDLKIGDKFRTNIDQAIRVHDKLLLVLSENSILSDWVENEVEMAFERERREKRTILFPIRLDDSIMDALDGWPADIRRTRQIGDFTAWKNHDAYQKVFDRLLRDLKSEQPAKATK